MNDKQLELIMSEVLENLEELALMLAYEGRPCEMEILSVTSDKAITAPPHVRRAQITVSR